MSGRKTNYVNVTSEEYSDLYNRAARADNIEYRVQQQLNDRYNQIHSEMSRQENRMNARIDYMNNEISGMRSDFRNLAQNVEHQMQGIRNDISNLRTETFHKIEESEIRQQKYVSEKINQVYTHIQEMDARFNQQLTNQWNATQKIINEQEEKFNQRLDRQWENTVEALQQQQEDYNRKIQDLRNDIKAKEEYEKKVAIDLHEDVSRYLELIKRSFNVEKFLPGKYQELASLLIMQNANIQNQLYQAAIAGSQQLLRDVLKFRTDIERAELEWKTYLEEAERHISATEVEVKENINLCKLTIPDGSLMIEYDAVIDRWTENGMTKLYEKVKREHTKLNSSEKLSTEDLKNLIKSSVAFRQENHMLVAKAIHNILQSNLRGKIIDAFTSGFNGTGWECVEEAWEHDDFNNAIYGKYRLMDDEIVVIISPKMQDGNVVNECDVHFFDNDKDPAFRYERLRAIYSALQETGLQFTQFQQLNDREGNPLTENHSVRDFERVRSKSKLN